MSAAGIIAELATMGVTVISPGPGRVLLRSDEPSIPQGAFELASPNKTKLADYLSAQSTWIRCHACGSVNLSDNDEGIGCDDCHETVWIDQGLSLVRSDWAANNCSFIDDLP
ncbi:hypothetical protein Pla52o_39320 [Novipirellula galeiformis]|uniref:Uncharacterized protein n=1 Tax=Novipirellula galeiformis TaxID=2528004 RepID=A0A5C6CCI8_9BACT|nr:hypothetical protein Pla52o_39320 [Novipirellula galeiformis]